jgi:hypothetical protein
MVPGESRFESLPCHVVGAVVKLVNTRWFFNWGKEGTYELKDTNKKSIKNDETPK